MIVIQIALGVVLGFFLFIFVATNLEDFFKVRERKRRNEQWRRATEEWWENLPAEQRAEWEAGKRRVAEELGR